MNHKLKIVIVLLFCLIISGCSKSYSGKEQPKAVNGVIDLSSWSFEYDGPVKLDGDWVFYWNSFVKSEPDDKKYGSVVNEYQNVPSSWTDKKYKNSLLPASGFASYRLKIIFPDKISGTVSLNIPSIDSACSFFVDDTMVYTNGHVGVNKDLSMPVYYAPALLALNFKKETDLTLHISNFHYPRPGIRDSLILGDTKTLSSGFEKLLVIDIFLIGAIFIMGMYHLGVFFLRRTDRSALYFALFCISTVIRLTVTGQGYAYRLEWFNWNIGTSIEYIFYYTSVATCGLFIHSLYPVEIGRIITAIIVSVCMIFTSIVLITPVMFYAKTLIFFNVFIALAICYFTCALILAIIRKRESAGIFLFGTVILFGAILNDILYNYRITTISYIMPYGLYSFFFVQSFLLSSKFSKAFASVEELSHNLEDKVAKRTAELEVEKEKLRLYNMTVDKEIELARIIQKELVPQICPNEFIHTLYKPMHKVGGDFFDFIRFRDSEKIGIFLSDVSGHGVHAAFITSMIKTVIIQASEKKDNPSDLLYYVNDILFNRTGGNYCTAFYGIFNPDERSLTYSIAGHNKPYLITEKSARMLDGFTGVPIGIMEQSDIINSSRSYRNEIEILPAGSKLLLYTDGFTEARSLEDGTIFEHCNIEEVLTGLGNLPCRRFVNDLYVKLKTFRGSDSFDDDVCLICLDVR